MLIQQTSEYPPDWLLFLNPTKFTASLIRPSGFSTSPLSASSKSDAISEPPPQLPSPEPTLLLPLSAILFHSFPRKGSFPCKSTKVCEHMSMEESTLSRGNQEQEVEEEYVLLDMDAVLGQVHIPPNAPYVLSGLDTLNPILTIDGKINLVGEYEETIGTCLVFSETDGTPVVHEETGPSEANLFQGRCIVEHKQNVTKEVKPITRLHKILKFRLLSETDIQDSTDKQTDDINL